MASIEPVLIAVGNGPFCKVVDEGVYRVYHLATGAHLGDAYTYGEAVSIVRGAR